MVELAAGESAIRLSLGWVDWLILAIYFAMIVWIGYSIHRQQKSSEDFLLAGRSMPAWIAGLAFCAANLGATEILGMAANGAQIGMPTIHYYLIGAVPGMVFLGIFMMPFYYGSGVRSVPEFMNQRFGKGSHLIVSLCFAVSTILQSGINLYAMALILQAMLGWSQWTAIIVSAVFVLSYITLGGLTSAIYNEVMQFFVIVAALIPVTVIGLHRVGGWSGLQTKLGGSGGLMHAWVGTGIGNVTNPVGGDWFSIIMGLGFVLGFGYWTTNFTEVQRAFAAKSMTASRMTPIVGAIPKMFIWMIIVIPGLIAAATVGNLFAGPHPVLQYNEAIPYLFKQYLPSGVLGIAVTGMMASFMAGMAANISSFNTVFTYDLWLNYVKPGQKDKYYLNTGRIITVIGVFVSVFTAWIASQFGNIMTYLQTLFSFFNAPLFAVFILGLVWKRVSNKAGTIGYICGIIAPLITYILYLRSVAAGNPIFGSPTAETWYGAIFSCLATWIVAAAITPFTKAKTDKELEGLTFASGGLKYFRAAKAEELEDAKRAAKAAGKDLTEVKVPWYKKPAVLGGVIFVVGLAFYIPFF
ncbi:MULTISPECIES: sodium:solute symporter family protein [Bifidobacterium]|jgi:SSS family solute:Na+ symporter|uniref:sodium:solute symporter family protein n=1 Tax=Bifidobacterium TaxID=1678 RepID=UPI002357D792|nr:sodium:solute symporter family protein [Bifidobacterium tibiigranuli]MCI1211883.1 sodium:solute symporter family protein [Bifidobacterium tibiigranuli]MCI1222188.1 sodium:solute symporter family protein [Bifidobacterium tibiigranuli]MCI1232498.1 sodium:solute symporter family protein [Bifidobacterium tibiigranuli]MCI1792339.1 sodium:solute symporter family protein [Bifidobacterium tibiigranuli]MCI1798398.1 sodium:solute symporter family protein [Bifidobacterium tibiigranuli]